MKNSKTHKVMKELFINDILIGMCFWSLIILILIPFGDLPQSLATVLYVFFIAASLICLPYSLYRIKVSLHLAKKGVEVKTTNMSVEHGYFGKKIKFEYEHDGQNYYKAKYYLAIFFPEENRLTLLIDTNNPSKFVILEFKKKSVITIIRERNS